MVTNFHCEYVIPDKKIEGVWYFVQLCPCSDKELRLYVEKINMKSSLLPVETIESYTFKSIDKARKKLTNLVNKYARILSYRTQPEGTKK